MKNLFLTCLLFVLSMNASALPELLPPEKAFQFSAEAIGKDRVKLAWKIADGYYLYRKKFAFDSETPNITLQSDPSALPPGEIKTDPNFGEIEVYHHAVEVEVPLAREGNAKQAIELAIQSKYQGCADAGLCYPPQKNNVTLQLAALDASAAPAPEATSQEPAPAAPTAKAADAEPIAAAPAPEKATTEKPAAEKKKPSLKSILPPSDAGQLVLPSDEAFKYNLVALDRSTLVAHWDVAPDHQLYRTKIKFSAKPAEAVKLGEPLFPTGKIVEDEYFGTMEVFGENIDVSIPLLSASPDKPLPDSITVTTEYQGCSDKTGICYPPVKQQTELQLTGLPDKTPSPVEGADAADGSTEAGTDYTTIMEDAGFSGTIVLFFGIGLLLAFTPCIFPMIPILSGVIAGQSDLSARKAFLLSLAYVVASATAYAIIGIVFGMFGANLQTILQHPIAIGTFAALFVTLALSMFGFFDLQLPSSLQTRLNELSNKQQSGSLVGAAIMGFLSTLIVGPCVAPPLAGALTYIAQTKDALLGGSALFTMGFAMGIPLLIVGTSAGHLLPRAGAWMDTTKSIFGMIMLGLAIWMLNRIVAIEVTMALVGILLIASGTYMGALDKLSEESTGWNRFWKSIGLIMVFYGAMQLLGVATGSTNLLQPLKGVFASGSNHAATLQTEHLAFQRIKGVAELDKMLGIARTNKQTVMLDFYADWCTECIRMEKNVFSRPEIIQALDGVMLLQADVTANDEIDTALQKHFGIIGPPTIIFIGKNSKEIKDLRLIGYENSQAFGQRIARLQRR